MKCPKCNEEIADGVKICPKCGEDIENATKEITKEKTKEVEEAKSKEENKIIDENQKNTQNDKEVNKKKTNKKKIIIIIAIIIALLAIAGFGTWAYLSSRQEQEEKSLEWGDVYLEILNDTDKLEDMDDQKIQLCDLDKNAIPELVIYGIKDAKEYIANIYKINDKNEADTIKVSQDNEFDLKLIYDANKDDYVWYAISEQTDNSKKIYNLNIENGTYESEEVTLNLGIDSLEIENNYSKKVDFNKDASKEEKEEILNQAIDAYVPTEEMITEEVKKEVENIKLLKNIKKIDPSKDIVYTVEEYKSTKTGESYKYPAINIDSEEVKKINSEIEENYGFDSSDYTTDGYILSPENEESGYKYYINGHILSLVVYNGGNDSVWSTAYNINLKDQSKITYEELLQERGLNKTEVVEKAEESAEKRMEEVLTYDKKAVGSLWDMMYPETEITTWKSEMKEDIENLTNVYLNENGDFCILARLRHAGGQYSCWKNIIINVTNNYSITELLLDIWNGQEQNLSIQTETTQTQNQSTNASTNINTNTNVTSSTSTSNIKEIIDLNKMKKFTYDTSVNLRVQEGTYTGPMGTLKITNSTGNSFNFEFECYKQTSGGYGPNIGMMSGVAKAIKGENFVFSEEKTEGTYSYKYNIFFYLAGNGITVEDECYDNISGKTQSPYCGNGVMFSGTYTK